MKMKYTREWVRNCREKLPNSIRVAFDEVVEGLVDSFVGIIYPLISDERLLPTLVYWPIMVASGFFRVVSNAVCVATPIIIPIVFIGAVSADLCIVGYNLCEADINAFKIAINNFKNTKVKSEPEAPLIAQPVAAAAASMLTAMIEPTPAVAQRRPSNDVGISQIGIFAPNSSSDVAPQKYVPENKKTM